MKKIKMIKTILSFILLTTIHTVVMGQVSDSVDYISNHQDTCKLHKFNVKQLIAPTTLIGIGIIGLGSDWMEYQNSEIRDELQENIDSKLTIDDFSQYAPLVSVYALNLCGVKGLHNFRDRTIISATAALLMGVTVNTLKYTVRIQRPDESSFNSFPSGHTATAFMGAEILRMEYKDSSPWIGLAGYLVATGTGFFRMYNNRHWFTDVVAGAGIGILSARAAYWMFPYIQKHLFGRKKYHKNNTAVIASPFISTEGKGLSCVLML